MSLLCQCELSIRSSTWSCSLNGLWHFIDSNCDWFKTAEQHVGFSKTAPDIKHKRLISHTRLIGSFIIHLTLTTSIKHHKTFHMTDIWLLRKKAVTEDGSGEKFITTSAHVSGFAQTHTECANWLSQHCVLMCDSLVFYENIWPHISFLHPDPVKHIF